MRRFALSLFLVLWTAAAAVPTPEQHLGYQPGADFKLADYKDVSTYFQALARSSDRIRLEEFGKSAEGKPMLVAFLSSPENLASLDRHKQTVRRLALGQATPDEARKLAAEGKAIVWIDSGLHASEVAPVQHSFDLAYRMVTAEDPETRRIRDRVILLQVPVINPDGLDWIAHWYRKNVGTPFELAPLPLLYQKYAGHDNNRDYFMYNLPETRHVGRMLFREWFPQIVYNQHQAPAFPARIFVPPYAEPLNPNIPAPLMEGINLIGAAMKERFARENKPGVLSYWGFDGWWNGGLRSAPAFHNMHGILTETALYNYATPGNYKESDLPERFGNGIPTKEPSVFYQRPWMGGRWALRDAIEYMLTADFAILDLASKHSEDLLLKSWELARAGIEAGNAATPYAYVVPAGQWDDSAAQDMVRRLDIAGVEVRRAKAPFQAGGRDYPAGSWVLLAGQPFRPYLVDLMEKQKYPEIRTGATGPTKRPYDVAGWTLPLNMGVESVAIKDRFQADLESVSSIPEPAPVSDHRQNASFLELAKAVSNGGTPRWNAEGKLLRSSDPGFAGAPHHLRQPRVGLYVSHTANMDTGWTRFLLDTYKIPVVELENSAFNRDLPQLDVIILAAQSMQSILHGTPDGESLARERDRYAAGAKILQRPEYTGGIGLAGAARLEKFVRDGGMLIAFDSATELPIELFGLPLRSTARSSESGSGYYSPGSIIRIDVDPANPIAFGMPAKAHAFTSGGTAWDITLLPEANKGDREVRSIARYAATDLLASGWISGERAVLGKHILVEARHGKGSAVLFGFRPQFRAQTSGTFKFILNSIYLAATRRP